MTFKNESKVPVHFPKLYSFQHFVKKKIRIEVYNVLKSVPLLTILECC